MSYSRQRNDESLPVILQVSFIPVALCPVLPASPFAQKEPAVLALVSTPVKLSALFPGVELTDVVGCDASECCAEFRGELTGVPEDVPEFFEDVFSEFCVEVVVFCWVGCEVGCVSVELFELIGDLTGFSDETEDAVVCCVFVSASRVGVDGRESGVLLVVVERISAGTTFGP